MKMNTEAQERYYFAYYKKYSRVPTAISTSEALVVEYMETHRHTKKKDYTIYDDMYFKNEILMDYEYALIDQYEDWYLPNIDIVMIGSNRSDLEKEFEATLEGLKTILLLAQGVKKIPKEDKNVILQAIQVILKFKNKKKIWERFLDDYKLTEFIFLDIEEYWKRRIMFIQEKEAHDRWAYAICQTE